MKSVDNLDLVRWRDMDSIHVLRLLADHIKEDPSFHPRSSHLTSRWHVHAAGNDWEFLCTGPKFLDVRMDRGGGGAVDLPAPTDEECQRYYDARRNQYVVGQAVHLRHILFAVTPGVNVQALSVHADKALISLLGRDVPVDLFGKLAGELSNCPTSTQGGDLGWIGPQDCAPELANTLFFQTEVPVGLGVQPRLIHTRFGFHIIDVLERRDGKALAFDEVRERVAAQLAMQSRAKALHQYMSLLVGQALVEGIELDAADSPLVQ